MCEKYFVERQSCRAVHSKGVRLLRFSALSWRHCCWVPTISEVLERPNWLVHAIPRVSWIGRCWGNNSHDTLHCSYFKTSETRWRKIFGLTNSKIESSSCRCTTTSIGDQEETKKFVHRILQMLLHTPQNVLKDIWSFSGPGPVEKWYGTLAHKPNGSWNDVADLMMVNVRESGHPLFRGSSAFFRGGLKSKAGGRTTTHCNADPATAELLLRSIISVYQLTIYGAEADWCEELAQQIADHSSTRTGHLVPKVKNESESKVAPTDVSILTKSPLINVQARRNSVQQHREKFENLPEDIRVSKASEDAGFIRKVSRGQHFVAVHDRQLAGLRCAGSCREYTSPRDDEGSEAKAWTRGGTKIGTVLEVKVTNHKERYGKEIKIDSKQNDGTQSWTVISRGINKYVTELPEENKKPIHYEEVATGAGQLAAMKQKEQFIPSSSSSSSTIMPINQRR